MDGLHEGFAGLRELLRRTRHGPPLWQGPLGQGPAARAHQHRQLAQAPGLRRVRVCCGDWSRILGPSPTIHIGTTAVFLDPPYAAERASCYAEESFTVAHDVRAWCQAHGDDPRLRIALCGYAGEHNDLEDLGWTVTAWKAPGGYAGQRRGEANANNTLERIWFSPHCLGLQNLPGLQGHRTITRHRLKGPHAPAQLP